MAVLEVGWLGAFHHQSGQSMAVAVIAAAVIGGADRSGGTGTAFGPVIGAALIEVIRNSLPLLDVDAFWPGTFVDSFIVLAVMFDKLKGSLAEPPARCEPTDRPRWRARRNAISRP